MKLDVVRRYRAQVEDVLRMDLLRARQNLQDAEVTCQALDTQTRVTAERYCANASAGMALEEFIEWQATFDAGAALLTQSRLVEGRLRDEWHQKQNDLRDAMQERRTLDRLAERVRLQQRVLQHRVEQMQMDEVARRTSTTRDLHSSL
jgi:flagellar export protein FliJ